MMGSTQDEKGVLAYWDVLVRRRWAVILSTTAALLIALIGSYVAEPRYRSTTTLQIERRNPDILTFRDVSQVDYSWTAYSDFYQTQYKILGSDPVARLTVERLGLDAHPRLTGESGGRRSLRSRLRGLLPGQGETVPRTPGDLATKKLLAGLEIVPVRNSHLVKVSWVSPDPDLAARIANGVADSFIQINLQAQFSTSGQAEEFLGNQIGSLKLEIADLETKLQDYGESRRIVSIDDQSNLTLQALQDLGQRRTTAQAELARAEAAWHAKSKALAEGLPEVLQSPLIAELRQNLALLQGELGQQSRQFGDQWPEVQNLRSKIEIAREQLSEETERIATQTRAAAESDYVRARAELGNLDELLNDQEGAAQRLKRESVEYTNLQSDVQKKRETLNALITRHNEMSLATRLKGLDTTSSNIRVLDTAKPANKPFEPDTEFNLILGLLLGLGAGIGLAILLDRIDNTVSSVDDLRRAADWPLLAIIPHHSTGAGGTPPFKRLMRRQQATTDTTVDLVAHRDGRGGVAEAYRDLRTAILLSSAGHAPRTIVVTSALPGEGKSATAINLAVVLAQTGARVLLVDTDLRKPRLHRAFDVDNPAGVSSYLSGMRPDAASLVLGTEIRGLDLLTSGPVPPNPSELLNSAQFRQMSADLLDSGYDHLVFDSPPSLSVSDSVIVATSMDCCILVVRADITPRPSVRLAVEKLGPATAGTTGLVLNDLEASRWNRGHYGGAYYGQNPEEHQAPAHPTEKLMRPGGGPV